MKLKKLSKIIAAFVLSLTFLGGAFVSTPVFADSDPCSESLPQVVRNANNCGNSNGTTNTGIADVLAGILNSVIGIGGIIAVIFIVVGGITYMTSTGDPGKTKKAKDTILYALIGLVVCAMAFAIVNWVVVGVLKNKTSDDQSTSQTESTNKKK